ncbi:hypothetical protein CYR55_09975 [Chimaeribacter californicus]|uniref:Uncharacterized protein n=1 Tax=Chimaeribacter californicus TaxID=2060067 RepID=A0A2N5E704_9GAMM|nr:hypothetical protein [Chimaeribacter californicus]PLR37261.1 hypothetical protein CYR55_09975 [Chimaeribacter californicus]
MKWPALFIFCPVVTFYPGMSWGAVTPENITYAVSEFGADKMMEVFRKSDAQWRTVTAGIAHGEETWLNLVPLIGAEADEKQTGDVMNALSFALVADPLATLRVVKSLDTRAEKGAYALGRFGTDIVCGVPMTLEYTRQSTLNYYYQVRQSLEKIGDKGAECLALIKLSMEEIEVEERRGNMTWGTKTWP